MRALENSIITKFISIIRQGLELIGNIGKTDHEFRLTSACMWLILDWALFRNIRCVHVPALYKETRFYVDRFHSRGHIGCSKGYWHVYLLCAIFGWKVTSLPIGSWEQKCAKIGSQMSHYWHIDSLCHVWLKGYMCSYMILSRQMCQKFYTIKGRVPYVPLLE